MPPLVVGSGQVQPLPRGGPALGIATAATYEEQSVDLGADQTLVVYSDGVTEAMNEANAFFGDERLLASLRETAGRAAVEVARHLLGARRRLRRRGTLARRRVARDRPARG